MFGVGAIPWSPLARGLLGRPLSEQTKRGQTDKCVHGPWDLHQITHDGSLFSPVIRFVGGYKDNAATPQIVNRYTSIPRVAWSVRLMDYSQRRRARKEEGGEHGPGRHRVESVQGRCVCKVV